MLGEPPHTEYDWKFNLFGIPVRVHPFFWLVTLLMGFKDASSADIIIWIGVVFLSIMVHEFGHAFAIQYFGWSPRVVLHGFGGLAIHDSNTSTWSGGGRRSQRTPNTQILISLAGPAAGFALAALVVLLIHVTGHYLGKYPVLGVNIPLGRDTGTLISNPNLVEFIVQMLFVNIYWGILNLMPIYPLDGGQVARELFLRNTNNGLAMSLQLSIATAVVLVLVAVVRFESFYMAFMFGYLGYLNYQQLSGPYGGRRW